MPSQNTDVPLHFDSLSAVCRRIKSGELSSLAVTEALLTRISCLEPKLHSFALRLDDAAREQAKALDAQRLAGKPLGSLHGVPIAIKDLLFTQGIPTASGTLVMRDYRPAYTATVVTRLEQAGAVIVGKTQLTEGAFGAHHPAVTTPVNPWNADYWSGVSSSGSGVSVAAGLAYGALGSDTGGSIRFPSAACGLVGIKGTYGRVSRYGAFELAASLDHIGPMTRNVPDAARILSVIAGEDPNDPTTLKDPVPNYLQDLAQAVPDLRIGVDWDYVTQGVNPVVVAELRNACGLLRDLGARVVDVTLPDCFRTLVTDWSYTCGAETARAHADYYPARAAEYGPDLSFLIDRGRAVSAAQYTELESVRTRFRSEFEALFQSMDVFACPAMPGLTPTVERLYDGELADFLTFTAPFDYSGHPTISLPIGLHQGMPTGFQLVGALGAESTLVRAGSAFEHARGAFVYPEPLLREN